MTARLTSAACEHEPQFCSLFGVRRGSGRVTPRIELAEFAGALCGRRDHDEMSPVLRRLSFALKLKVVALWQPTPDKAGQVTPGADVFERFCFQLSDGLHSACADLDALLRAGSVTSLDPERLYGGLVAPTGSFERESGYSYARLAPAGPTWQHLSR